MASAISSGRLDTFVSTAASRNNSIIAAGLCVASVIATLIFLPVASRPLTPMPGFLALNQAALALVYGLTAWFFVAQYRITRAPSLLALGAGSVFTTLIVLIQLGCFPNILAQGLVLGQGGATLIWLWIFWHLGPPLFAVAYVMIETRQVGQTPRRHVLRNIWMSLLTVAFCAALVAVVTTRYAANLPRVADPGDGYASLTSSGIGPVLFAFTALTLVTLCWTTRLRTMVQVWLAASLFLLLMDNVITDAGAARATLGWYVGRIEALLAGIAILCIYLSELDHLYRRAADAVDERDGALREASAARDNLEVALDASGMGDWDLDLLTGRSRRTLRHDRIFGYQNLQDEWGLDRLIDHVVPDDRDLVRNAFEAARAGKALNIECRIKRSGDSETRWIGLWGKTSFGADGQPKAMAGCVVDATERRSNEERLREAERMEAIGQLTGGVAHDFNNLLTVIMGSLDMIKRRPEDVVRTRRLAENAFQAGRRGAEMTEKLLSFSRRQVVSPKIVNLNRLLSNFDPLVKQAVGETIEVVIDLDAQLDPAHIDIGQFQAAILNLAGNARDAMTEGGVLKLRTRNVTLPGGVIDPPLEAAPGEYVQVIVSDTGTGMDEATASRAFDPFFTTKDVGRGTGLGLSQVYGFVRQAGGYCKVRTTLGDGCAIELYLPRSVDQAFNAIEVTNIAPLRHTTGQEVVLIVEDEDAVREMAAESLQSLGYTVLTASDARVALDLIRAPGRLDILFSDVVMPGGMNGAQLTMEARALRPDLKVLLTSGYTLTATGGSRELPTDVPLLRKPYLREELATKLQAVLKIA